MSISAYNNYYYTNNIYYKACLVEVVKIIVEYTIFRLYILYKLEPRSNKLEIFV
jgi:hypothetical protein